MNLIVVDMQPCYDHACSELIEPAIEEMEKADNIIMFWVGDGLSEDTEDSVAEYWMNYGATPETVSKIRFIEKGYGFFRDWMDTGVPDDTIIDVVRYMNSIGLSDSRDVPDKVMRKFREVGSIFPGWEVKLPDIGGLFIPKFDLDLFKGKEWKIFGGARYECLPEVELWLKAHYIETERLDHLSWG